MSKLYLIAMLAATFAFAMGCDNSSDSDDDTDTTPIGDGGVNDGGTGNDIDVDTSECESTKTCAYLVANGEADRCVADFSLGTCQAGNPDPEWGYSKWVGFYGYNDTTKGAVQIPKNNPEMVEAAEKIVSCDPEVDYALHFKAEGFTDWGAGVGMDWSGPANPACDEDEHPGALDCLAISYDDNKWTIAKAKEKEACQGDDQEAFLECLTKGKNFKEVRDLSDYIGIGFWVLATEAHEASALKISFPIPETTRFYSREMYDGQGCTDEDDDDSNNCFNDFALSVNFKKTDVGKWVYKEVMFEDTTWNIYWGLQLDDLNPPITQFPRAQSIGIKMQVDVIQSTKQYPYTDFYLDDVILVK